MKLTVVESPLAGDFERNRRYAIWCAFDCYVREEAAYASHLFFPLFLDDEKEIQRNFGMKGGLAWAEHADIFAFYTDLGMSGGMVKAWDHWHTKIRLAREFASQYDFAGKGARQHIETRKLAANMLTKFEMGAMPGATKGF